MTVNFDLWVSSQMWKRTFCGFVRLWLRWIINLTELDGFALFSGRLQLFLLIRGQAGALSKTSTCVCVCVVVCTSALSLSGSPGWCCWFWFEVSFVSVQEEDDCSLQDLSPANPHISILYYIILYSDCRGLMHIYDFRDRQVWHWPVWVTAVQSEEAWKKQKTEFGFINIHVYKETYVFMFNFHLPIQKTEHIIRLKMKQDVSRTEF